MASINFDSELRRAGAHSTHGWRRLAFLAQRYMLGTFGLIIMVMFVWMAISADLICRYDPLSVDSAHRLAAPSAQHWMGTDSFGRDVWSRIIHGARISLAVGIGATVLGSSIGVHRGSRVRLSVRLGRPAVPAHHRYPAGPAAAGAGAGDDRGAGSVAAERDHRDRDSADPDSRPRDPRQYAGAARAAVRRGRQVDRHERDPHRASATFCPTRWRR